jgi:F0F1-type ATP synthase assembly protein I
VEDKQPPSFLSLAGLGISIAICVAGGVLLGLYVDEKAHTSPVFVLIGLLLGVVCGVGLAYVEIKRLL